MDTVLQDLARAKAAFQLRAIAAVVCADARSKPDQMLSTPPDGQQPGGVVAQGGE